MTSETEKKQGSTSSAQKELSRNDSSAATILHSRMSSCMNCHTTTTPLWRSGPAGPRSLCNACGIRYRKANKRLFALDKGRSQDKRKRKEEEKATEHKILWAKSLGEEEEQAAILLMTLSSGSGYASQQFYH